MSYGLILSGHGACGKVCNESFDKDSFDYEE
jgi:hypothetical protein